MDCMATIADDYGFHVVGTDHLMFDPFQRMVVLQKR